MSGKCVGSEALTDRKQMTPDGQNEIKKPTSPWKYYSFFKPEFGRSNPVCCICNGPCRGWPHHVCLQKRRKQKWKFLSKLQKWIISGKKQLFILSFSQFAKPACSNLPSNLKVSRIHSRLNCCLFYSVVLKAPVWGWMPPEEKGSLDAQHSCWHITIAERPSTWFTQAECHSNCQDLYQWEKADEVPQLSDLTDLICAQMLAVTLKACRLTNFTWNVPPQLVLTELQFFMSVNGVWSGTFTLWTGAFNKPEFLSKPFFITHYSFCFVCFVRWHKTEWQVVWAVWKDIPYSQCYLILNILLP